MEIEMSPLPKALFFLFLKHPEGIMFKTLHNYQEELLNIYQKITNREVLVTIKQSILDICDPSKNSINEKCSRIREAFLKKFDDSLAKNYYITGQKGEAKRIILDRNLLIWDETV